MAYETGSGTLQTMLDNLATFALAHGWIAPTPADHRYWSVLGRSYDESGTRLTDVDFISMAESSGGANVLTGGTASATAGTASNALVNDGTLWSVSLGSSETRWTYDLGLGNAATVVELIVKFGPAASAWKYIDLQFSDDGSTWTTLKSWRTDITTAGQTFTGLWEADYWPLSPDGGSNFVMPIIDFGISSTGFTVDGGSFPITGISQLYLNVGRERLAPIGNQGSIVRIPTQTIDEWHFFADDTDAVHVHVAFKLTYQGSTFWHHFSAGVIDTRGMGHNGVAYCTSSLLAAMIETNDISPNTGTFHSTLYNCGYFMGLIGGSSTSTLCYRLTQTGGNFPYPNDGNFPAHSETHLNGYRAMPTLLAAIGARRDTNQLLPTTVRPPALGSEGWRFPPHPTTGFVTLGTLPLVVGSSDDATSADLRWLGEFPNVRSVRVDNLEPTAEITVGSDIWMCFPLLRKVSAADVSWPARTAQSGPAGIAYKKVA